MPKDLAGSASVHCNIVYEINVLWIRFCIHNNYILSVGPQVSHHLLKIDHITWPQINWCVVTQIKSKPVESGTNW